MPDFYTVVTDTGLQALGLAATQGQSFSLIQAVVGDGNGLAVIPNKGMTTLVNEVWRGDVTGIKVDPDDPNTFIFEFAIPADTGGFTLREVGLLDESGKLFCIGNFPDTEKPVAVNGSVRDLVVRLPLHFANADVVNLVINAAIALATKQDVLDHNKDPQAHLLATTAQTGFVRLATDAEHIVHECKTVAATPWGVWKLVEAVKSDAVDLANSLKLATSQAVQSVQDALNVHDANTIKHVPAGGNIGEALLRTDTGVTWGKVNVVSIPVGQIYSLALPPDEFPEHHYVPNGEGLLKISEAGKTLLSMSTAYKAAHRVTDDDTHVFLPNVFDVNGDGYFPRFVDGISRKVGSRQADAAPNIVGSVRPNVTRTNTNSVSNSGALANTSMYKIDQYGGGSYSLNGGTLSIDASRSSPVYGRESSAEIRPKNYGLTPAIYLPPLEA